MEDYKKKYLKYKKKYMMLKLGGSKNRTVTKDQLTQPQFTEAQKEQRRLTLNKLLRHNNVEDFLKNNKVLNDLLINNKNKLKKQLDPKNIYEVVTGNEKKQFWKRVPHSLRQYFKNYREENSKNIENFMIYTKSIDDIRYLINEFYIFNDIILCELKKISLTNLENFLKINKLNENKRNEINDKIKEISNFEISNCDINNTDKKSAKVLVEEPQKNTKSEESQKPPPPWIKAAEKSDKVLEKNTKSDDFFGIKVDTNIIHTHIEPYDNCNPYFMNDNMSLYTNDYLEKYLIRTKIKIDYYIIQPSDVLLSTLIPKNASLISIDKNEYVNLDLGFQIIIIYKDEEKGKWNSIEEKAHKWIQSLRQIDKVKNHNGFIDYIIKNINNNKVITYVRELLLLNIYNYINGNKNESLNKKICSICSLYNDKNEINSCLMSIPNNHYTFNKDVFCVLLKTNEFTGKLELPEKINEDNNNNEYNVEGTYYFITKSNYTNKYEYILSINDFDVEFREALLKHCERQDEIQNNCFKLKKNIEKKISLNINVDKHKKTNNELDKQINYSKRLSIRIGSISSIIYVGKFITKNLLLTSCSCPFIINNVDATVKMLQDINYEYNNSYADPELKFRESIIQIPNNQKTISNPIDLEEEYIQYAVNHKNRKISLFDTQREKEVKLRQERQTNEYHERNRKINPQQKAEQRTVEQKTSNVIEKYQLKFDKEYLNECKLDLSTEKNSQFIFTLVRTDKNSDNTCKDILEFYVLTKPLGSYRYIATGSNQYKTLIYDRHDDLLKKINLNEITIHELNSKINNITNINYTKNKKDIFIAFTLVGEDIITYLITFEEFMEMINKKFIEFGKKVNDSYDNIKKKYVADPFSLTEQENNLILIDSVYTDIKNMLLKIDNDKVNVFDNDTIEYLVKIPNIGSQIIPPKKEIGLQNNKIVTEDLINYKIDDLDYGSIEQSDIEENNKSKDKKQSDKKQNNKSKDRKQKNKSKEKNNKFGRENYY